MSTPGCAARPGWHPSPNHGPRRDGARPDLVVLHYTAMADAEAALARLCDPGAEVSAHYLVGLRGEVWHLVDEARRAWHAGAGAWGGVTDVNSRSIGIELANRGDHPFPVAQMAALETLLRGVLSRWEIPPERVIGHADMAPGRKIDPGPRFDWRGLARAGLSVWPDPAEGGAFLRDAARFGYRCPRGGEAMLLQAFRDRFRPGAEGPLTPEDSALAAGLARRWPVRG
ncbi:MAG: N-acetylmuramoyl-L-alanine amidase [Paracoccaceae bacterium]